MTRRLFAGNPELLLTRLVEDEEWSEDDLQRMRALLDERLDREEEP
jgi:hypothetical protein